MTYFILEGEDFAANDRDSIKVGGTGIWRSWVFLGHPITPWCCLWNSRLHRRRRRSRRRWSFGSWNNRSIRSIWIHACITITNKNDTQSVFHIKKVKIKADIALHGNPISELRDVTCHMGSHQPPDTSERAPPNPSHAGWYSIYLYPGGMEG